MQHLSGTLDLALPPVPAPDMGSYDWIVINSSAGKDSLAMLSHVSNIARCAGVDGRLIVVHCDLGRVEWPGTRELAERQAQHFGLQFVAVWRRQGDLLQEIEIRKRFPSSTARFCTGHHKTSQVDRVMTQLTDITAGRDGDLLQQVSERGMWPDLKRRYCTSDQKRAQVHRLFTAISNHQRSESREGPVRILNCMGMRSDESPSRAKKSPFGLNTAASNSRRHVDDWLPLHQWSLSDVWGHIRTHVPADLVHYAYGLGMPRLSCCFCIFSPRSALLLAGKHNRALLDEYTAVERKIGHRFKQDLALADIAAALDAGEEPARVSDWRM